MSLLDVGKKFLSGLANIRIYKGGVILFGDSHYKIKGPHVREIMNLIEPGDIILRKYNNYLSNKLISFFSGTYWPHVAIYVGDYNDEPGRVIHMVGKGASNDDLLTFLRADDIKIMRCDNPSYVEGAIELAKYHYENETKYDGRFSLNNDELYCSELIMQCYDKATFYDRVSKMIIYPDDFLKSIFYTVWEKE